MQVKILQCSPTDYGLIDLHQNESYFAYLNVLNNTQKSTSVGLIFTTKSASLTLESCSFFQNKSPNLIVAVNNTVSKITLVNCSFIENQCTNEYIGYSPATVDAKNVLHKNFRIMIIKIKYCDPYSLVVFNSPIDFEIAHANYLFFAAFINIIITE